MIKARSVRTLVAAACVSSSVVPCLAAPRGPSPYLPLNLSPRIERQIERVLILADKPVIRRPIAAATVLDALPKACEIDQPLCTAVRQYLRAYISPTAVTMLDLELAAS